jgi:hypothetical protein
VPDVSGDHVIPAFVDLRIAPASPTTKAIPESSRCTPFRLLIVPEVATDHCPKTYRLEQKTSDKARKTVLPLNIELPPVAVINP